MYVDGSTVYSEFNQYTLQASAATATTNNNNNKGGFLFILNSLLPFIDTRYAPLSYYKTLDIDKGE